MMSTFLQSQEPGDIVIPQQAGDRVDILGEVGDVLLGSIPGMFIFMFAGQCNIFKIIWKAEPSSRYVLVPI